MLTCCGGGQKVPELTLQGTRGAPTFQVLYFLSLVLYGVEVTHQHL